MSQTCPFPIISFRVDVDMVPSGKLNEPLSSLGPQWKRHQEIAEGFFLLS